MEFFATIASIVRRLWRGRALPVSDAVVTRNDYRELRKAVSGIVYLRNKLSTDLSSKLGELHDVTDQLPVAVVDGEDEVALVLLQKRRELAFSIGSVRWELGRIREQARETAMQLRGLEAPDGKSTAADLEALENVDAHLSEVEPIDEVLERIRNAQFSIREELDALKRLRRGGGSGGGPGGAPAVKG